MPITGITSDGAVVYDDTIDSRGRRVIDATARILEDGTHYFALEAEEPAVAQQKLVDCNHVDRVVLLN